MEKNKRASADSRSSHCQRNDTDNGLTPEQFLEKKKAEGVALVMAEFKTWLDKRLDVITYAYETAGMSEDPAANSGGTGSQDSNASGKSQRSSKRPKRQFGEDDPNNSSSGGDENGRDNGGNKRAKKDTDTKKRFACPYYKHDPRTHRRERTCCGPGWDSIHRLKCGEPFDGTNELNAHLRADTLCEKVDIGPMDGVDEEMEAKLKVRKAYTGLTEEQKWREIYLILFPKANRETVPSPYYDGNDGLGLNKSAAEWKKVERRIRKELPKYVQKKVERKFEHLTVDTLSKLADIVRDGLHELLGPGSGESPADSPVGSPKPAAAADYHHQQQHHPEERPHAAAAAAAAATTTTTTTVDEEDGDNVASLNLSYFLGEGEQLFLPEFGNMEFTNNFVFDSFGDCSTFEVGSDSGYASGSTGRGAALM
ncbi:hypothetical protein SLS62_001672 [Diatrype stigma]|uniref:C2H2-type domain-containing protein n=1 Tax=Diatrype stigma TaxID=117547 RepID=A0AAN9UYW6_9PEZI